MRNPRSLCAVALSLALTSPASSAPNLSFVRSDWQVVVVSFPNAALNAAVKRTCDGGTLVASKAAVNERSQSLCKNAGFNCKIPLVCVHLNANGTAAQSPVDATVLDLTVYGPFGMEPSYELNRGRGGSGVVLRAPMGAELTYVAPSAKPAPPPAKPGPSRKPKSKTPVAKRRVHKKPAHKKPVAKAPPVKGPAAHAAPALSPLEGGWLMPEERTVYKDAVKAAKKTSAALQLAYKNARETVAKNLRDALREPYKTDVKDGRFDKIDALLYGKNYSGLEVDLSPAEYGQLKTVLKTATEHTDFVEPNAAAQYDFERKSIVDSSGKAKLSEHVLAHKIAMKFRAMLPGAKPGTSASGAPVELTDADFAKIPSPADRDALHKAYNEEWAKADTDDKKRAVNETYLKKIAAAIAAASGASPTKPTTPFDPSAIKTLPQLLLRNDKEQKQFCSMLIPGGGGCGNVAANGFDATKACLDKFPPVAGDKTGDANTKVTAQRVACETEINACKPQSGQAAPLKIDPKDMPALHDHCIQVLAGSHPPVKPAVTAGSEPPSPTTTDSAPGENQTPPKTDPAFVGNVANGTVIGLGALLLASFFGGPLLMLGVAVAAGVGGYFLSKKMTGPP